MFYATQFSDLFVTYTGGFNMHTGQPNIHSVINEYISGRILMDPNNNEFILPALTVSNNFATKDYGAHSNTKLTLLVIMFSVQ